MQPTSNVTCDDGYYLYLIPRIQSRKAQVCSVTEREYDVCLQLGNKLLDQKNTLRSFEPLIVDEQFCQLVRKINAFSAHIEPIDDLQNSSTSTNIQETAAVTSVEIVRFFSSEQITARSKECLRAIFTNVFAHLQSDLEHNSERLNRHFVNLQNDLGGGIKHCSKLL